MNSKSIKSENHTIKQPKINRTITAVEQITLIVLYKLYYICAWYINLKNAWLENLIYGHARPTIRKVLHNNNVSFLFAKAL